MFGWIARAIGHDGGLAKIVKAGHFVRHSNTHAWGEVLEVVPQRDDTAELRVRVIGEDRETWWATYHIGEHRVAAPAPSNT